MVFCGKLYKCTFQFEGSFKCQKNTFSSRSRYVKVSRDYVFLKKSQSKILFVNMCVCFSFSIGFVNKVFAYFRKNMIFILVCGHCHIVNAIVIFDVTEIFHYNQRLNFNDKTEISFSTHLRVFAYLYLFSSLPFLVYALKLFILIFFCIYFALKYVFIFGFRIRFFLVFE